jgi:vancomycin resistance protein YoaR
VLAAGLVLATAALGLAFAGSSERLADGVEIGGVDVGGLTPSQARRFLERRAASVANVPVTFTDGRRSWRLRPTRLGIRVDWAEAVETARRQSGGLGPLRGLRRIEVRVFGSDIAPPTSVYRAALDHHLDRIDRSVSDQRREAAVVLKGLRPVVVPGRTGRALDRAGAARVIVRALARVERAPVPLPIRVEAPRVTAAELARAAQQARTAVSAPVRLVLGPTRWRVPRWRIAELLSLPRDGRTEVRIGGPRADRYFGRLQARVARAPRDAAFELVGDGGVAVVPSVPGLALDADETAAAFLRAALSRTNRTARAVARTTAPDLTTAEAERLRITSVLGSYSTYYAGTADRIHNLQLAVALLDGTLVPPGETFSLNGAVGPRTSERGFRAAPVIINAEYKEGVGGGVSQVATTVFNAAWEAGLKIVQRAPHSLYISRYPLGRDATVNYPDLDLRFLNDTDGWLVVRGLVGETGITIAIAGAPHGRRVVSEAGPLVVTGPAPLKRVPDSTLVVGDAVVEEEGSPSTVVEVKRTVYEADGTVRASEVWRTRYVGEKRIVRFGTKPKPKPEPEPKPKPKKPEEKPPAEPQPPAGSAPGVGVNPAG